MASLRGSLSEAGGCLYDLPSAKDSISIFVLVINILQYLMSQNNDSIASWICERITAKPLLALFSIISLTRACIGKFRSPTSRR